MSEEKRMFASGVTSTKQPRLSLIPHKGLTNVAIQYELGLEIHGENACNNLNPNKQALVDRDWLIERASHAAEHCLKIIDYLLTMEYGEALDVAIRDAGAVGWAGCTLGEALIQRKSAIQCGEAGRQSSPALSEGEARFGGSQENLVQKRSPYLKDTKLGL